MDWFDALQRAQLGEFASRLPQRAAWLREQDAVYLYGTIGSEAVLLRDGSVRLWRADDWPRSEEYTAHVAEASERTAALVLGAEEHPILAELLPSRTSTARTCPQCDGAGRVEHSVICPTCSGLGWIEQAT